MGIYYSLTVLAFIVDLISMISIFGGGMRLTKKRATAKTQNFFIGSCYHSEHGVMFVELIILHKRGYVPIDRGRKWFALETAKILKIGWTSEVHTPHNRPQHTQKNQNKPI